MTRKSQEAKRLKTTAEIFLRVAWGKERISKVRIDQPTASFFDEK